MVLRNELYTILITATFGAGFGYDIRLQPAHFIYKAHFPGEPITPGVCVIQIARELLEDHLGRPLSLQAVKNVKFLNVISPLHHPLVRYTFRPLQQLPEGIRATVDVTAEGTPMTQLSFTVV